MVRREPRSRQGLASIMDAFMFLLAVIALSSFLLSVQEGREGNEEDSSQELVDRAHSVLVSLTLALPEDELQNDSPVVEITSLIQPDINGDLGLPDWAVPLVERIISELIGPSWGFEWSAVRDAKASTLVTSGSPSSDNDIFASSIQGSNEADLAWRLVLRVWAREPNWAY